MKPFEQPERQNVLLVEDSEDDYVIMRDLLADVASVTGVPIEVEWVSTYADARRALLTGQYDVCLMDYHLGERSALELLEELPASHTTPVILVTGNEDHAVDVAVTKAGACDYLLKDHLNASMLERSLRYATERAKREARMEEALHQSRLLTTVVSNLSDGMVVTDPRQDGNPIIFANAGFYAITGYTTEEVLGRNCRFLQGPETDPQTVQEMRQAMAEARPFAGVIRNYRKDGTSFWNGLKITPIFDEQGQLINFVGSQADVTERRQAEIALQESEANLARAQQIAHVGSWEIELSADGSWNGGGLRWSAETFRMLGYEPGQIEVSNEIFFQAVHPDDRQRVSDSMLQALMGQKPYDIEHRVVWPDGTERVIHSQASVIRDEETGTALKVVGTGQDITKRKHTEDSLQRTNALLTAVTEGTTDSIYAKDLQGRHLMMNSSGAQAMGYRAEEIMGKADADLVSPEAAALFKESDDRVIASRQVNTYEETATIAGGTRTYLTTKGPLYGAEGEVLGVVGITRDITERKRYEEELRSSTERFKILSRATNDAVYDWDLQTGQIWWNEGFETLFGYNRDEVEPGIESWENRVHPDDYERVNQSLSAAIESGQEAWSGEYLFRKADGDYAAIFDRGFIIRNSEGQPVRMVGSMQNVTERKRMEEALRASEARFRTLIQSSWDVFHLVTPQGEIIYESPAVSRVLGFLPEEMTGHNIAEFIHPEDLAQFVQPRDPFIECPGAMRTSLLRVRHKTKGWRWIESFEVNLIDHPDIGAIAVNYRDITERKEAEEQRDRFFTMSPELLCIASLDGYFKRVNPAFTEVLGFAEGELLAHPFMDMVHPEDRSATQDSMQSLSEGTPILAFENRYRSKDGSWRWLEWKATSVPEEGLIYAAARDVTERKKSEVTLLLMHEELEGRVQQRTRELEQANNAFSIEIAERESAEAEARKRARQQEAVAELGRRALTDIDMQTLMQGATALVAATLEVDISAILEALPDGKTLSIHAHSGGDANWKDRTVLGQTNSQAGYTMLCREPVIMTDVDQETRFQPSAALAKHGITSGATVVIQGYERPFGVLSAYSAKRREFSQNEVHFLQATANVLAAAIDRHRVETEIRELNSQLKESNHQLMIENQERLMTMGALQEAVLAHQEATLEAERANQAKSLFLSRMSHELRTPLNAILGFGQILSKEKLTPLQSEGIDYILKGGRHLLGLINEVLDISRVESGGDELALEPTALDDVVPEACALVTPLAEQRGITLDHQCDFRGSYVLANRQRLEQVLINLLSNAIKYNRPEGRVCVTCEKLPGDRIRIAVRDTGFGISADDMPKLFTPFERLGAANSDVEGTGLGLVLSQRLATAMGGSLTVESVVGEGTTFSLELAQTVPIGEDLTAFEDDALQPQDDQTPPQQFKVLCIEDNPSNLRLIEMILASRPEVTLISAMEGGEGLHLAREHEPDLILLDLNLPDMPGDEVLTRLQRSGITRDIPVIVVSADATGPHVQQLLEAGALAYLTKPVDVAEFLRVLDAVLRGDESDMSAEDLRCIPIIGGSSH